MDHAATVPSPSEIQRRWSEYLSQRQSYLENRTWIQATILGFSDYGNSTEGTQDAREIDPSSVLYIRTQCKLDPAGKISPGVVFIVPIRPEERSALGGSDDALTVICKTETPLVLFTPRRSRVPAPLSGNCLHNKQLTHFAQFTGELQPRSSLRSFSERTPSYNAASQAALNNRGHYRGMENRGSRVGRGSSSRAGYPNSRNPVGGVQRSGRPSRRDEPRHAATTVVHHAATGTDITRADRGLPANTPTGPRNSRGGAWRGRGGHQNYLRGRSRGGGL